MIQIINFTKNQKKMTTEQMTIEQKLNRANKLNELIKENFDAIESCKKVKGKSFEVEFFHVAGRSRNESLRIGDKHSDVIIDTIVSCMEKDMESYKEELEALFK